MIIETIKPYNTMYIDNKIFYGLAIKGVMVVQYCSFTLPTEKPFYKWSSYNKTISRLKV